MTRDEVESGLLFAGFIIISCPLKPDTKHVVKEILNSSHHITMITGDNPLTACHVAAQLRLIEKKSAFVLSRPDTEAGDQAQWVWKAIVDENKNLPLRVPNSQISMNHFCLTGEVINLRNLLKLLCIMALIL